ncbi:MAG: DnaJ C-terminal domain-containing protein, partial [Bacteroidota bacterium]
VFISLEFETSFRSPGGVGEVLLLRMMGTGNYGAGGGAAGDLIVLVEGIPHDELTREDNNVIFHLWLSFTQATLGDSVEVPTLDGKVRIKIDAGTQPGKMLRLKGKGFPDLNGYGTGDQLVVLNVYVPTKVSSEEKTMLEKLNESDNFKPSAKEKSFFDKLKDLF